MRNICNLLQQTFTAVFIRNGLCDNTTKGSLNKPHL